MVLLDDYLLETIFYKELGTTKVYHKNYITLQRKGIHAVGTLTKCQNITHCYLQNNRISRIENIKCMPRVRYLYLQDNKIASMSGIEFLHGLQILYINSNRLSVIGSLENCTELEELHVENQELPSFDSIYFDPLSLQGIAFSLRLLDTSGNNIKSIEPFACLKNLEELIASNNDISDLQTTCWTICHMPLLSVLNLLENPVIKANRFQMNILASTKQLKELNGSEVSSINRKFCSGFARELAYRSAKSSSGTSYKCSEQVQHMLMQLPTGMQVAVKKAVSEEMNSKSESWF